MLRLDQNLTQKILYREFLSLKKIIMKISSKILSELSPEGVLRAGINLSNFLLVSGRDQNGEPTGVAPDLARALAEQLGVPLRYIQYNSPGELSDDAVLGVWDVGLIGAEPQRAEKMVFSPAYAEIAAFSMSVKAIVKARLTRCPAVSECLKEGGVTPQTLPQAEAWRKGSRSAALARNDLQKEFAKLRRNPS